MLLTSIIGLLTFFFPTVWHMKIMIAMMKINKIVAKYICGIKVTVEGLENIPKNKVYLIASNHQSAWETFALQEFFYPCCFVLKKELTRIPFFGWGLMLLKPIPINRNGKIKALKQLISYSKERVKDKFNILIFPEGTRASYFENLKISKGAATIAYNNKIPILPLVHNSGLIWKRNSFMRYPGTIKVKIGNLIDVVHKKQNEIHQELEIWFFKNKNNLKEA